MGDVHVLLMPSRFRRREDRGCGDFRPQFSLFSIVFAPMLVPRITVNSPCSCSSRETIAKCGFIRAKTIFALCPFVVRPCSNLLSRSCQSASVFSDATAC